MLDVLLRHTAFVGIFLALLFSIGQLSVQKPNRRNHYFSGIYFCIACLLFASWNIKENLHYVVPMMSYWDLPFLFLLGPLVYLVIEDSAARDPIAGRAIHFVLPVVAFFGTFPHYMKPSAEKADWIYQVFVNNETYLYDYAFGLGMVGTTGYTLLGMKDLKPIIFNLSIWKSEKSMQLVGLIILMTLVAMGFGLAGLITRDMIFVRLSAATGTFTLGFIFIVGHRFPQFNQSLAQVVIQSQYKHSYIKDLDLAAIEKKLKDLMEGRKLYANEALSLSSLSKELDISMHQLSQFLNEHLKKNFARFVNEYRVAEAQKLLLTKRDQTILKIAYEVGFNSQTSFHRAFVGIVGITPSQYRAKQS